MGHAIPKQHPAVVLRSHYNLVRALLAAAMIALVGLAVALVIVADDSSEPASPSAAQAVPVTPRLAPPPLVQPSPAPEAVSPGATRSYSGPAATRKLDGSTDIPRSAPVAPGTRYDGGPEEGTRGAIQSPVAPGTRYDGGPEEGTRGSLGGAPQESQAGPGFRTD
jgi:hypothetical protein